jgi:alkylation response protein AidB-like acyl-CoA dehydrogenase
MTADLELLHVIATLETALLGLLVIVSALLAGLSALTWANAIAAAYRAHAHRLQLHASEAAAEVVEEAAQAAQAQRPPRAPYVPPTEAEIRASILAAREDREYTTHGNENIPETPPIPPGGLYRVPGEAY